MLKLFLLASLVVSARGFQSEWMTAFSDFRLRKIRMDGLSVVTISPAVGKNSLVSGSRHQRQPPGDFRTAMKSKLPHRGPAYIISTDSELSGANILP
jgi:hypothetical protein